MLDCNVDANSEASNSAAALSRVDLLERWALILSMLLEAFRAWISCSAFFCASRSLHCFSMEAVLASRELMAASKFSSEIRGPHVMLLAPEVPRFSLLRRVSLGCYGSRIDTNKATSSRVSRVSGERYSWIQAVIGELVVEDSNAHATSSCPSWMFRSSSTRSKRVSSGDVAIACGKVL